MNLEQQLELQAYLDGELSGREARRVAEWLAGDAFPAVPAVPRASQLTVLTRRGQQGLNRCRSVTDVGPFVSLI